MLRKFALLAALLLSAIPATAQQHSNMVLGIGDDIRIQVFQNPELTLETRISENGTINYPLIGSVALNSSTIPDAEQSLAAALEKGGYVKNPQVNIAILQSRANQVSILGQVTKPGRYPLESNAMRITDVLALSGGATSLGDDVVVLTGTRNSAPFKKLIDVPALFLGADAAENLIVNSGDTLFVPKAPVFYIYGEAQRPGSYRIERGMTVVKALATGGGPTARGSNSRLQLSRRNAKGEVEKIVPKPDDLVQPDDVIYVRESLF